MEPGEVVRPLPGIGSRGLSVGPVVGTLEALRPSVERECGHAGQNRTVARVSNPLETDFRDHAGAVIPVVIGPEVAGEAHLRLIHNIRAKGVGVGESDDTVGVVVVVAAPTVLQCTGITVMVVDGEADRHEQIVSIAQLLVHPRVD